MDQINDIKPLSSHIGLAETSSSWASGIVKTFAVGGFGLAFLFVGLLLLVISVLVSGEPTAYILAGVGLLLLVVVVVFFYQKEIRPTHRAELAVRANAELVDTVQETALVMSALAYDLQALSFKYAEEVAKLAEFYDEWESRDSGVARALSVLLELVDDLVGNGERPADLSATIVAATTYAQNAIREIENALAESDAVALKEYLAIMRTFDERVKEVLAT